MLAQFKTKKPSSFQLGLHHFNPPPKGKLIAKRQRYSLNNKGRAWGLNTVFRLEEQRDVDSI
jgi:hypothetical protein